MRPICYACGLEMECQHNGTPMILEATFGSYQIWHGDLWKCPQCGIQVVSGFGRGPVAERHDGGNFQAHLDQAMLDPFAKSFWSNRTEKREGNRGY